VTHSCRLDSLGDFSENLLVLCCIFASSVNFDWESTTFELIKILGCLELDFVPILGAMMLDSLFFWVVTMCSVSSVKSINVVGNS